MNETLFRFDFKKQSLELFFQQIKGNMEKRKLKGRRIRTEKKEEVEEEGKNDQQENRGRRMGEEDGGGGGGEGGGGGG